MTSSLARTPIYPWHASHSGRMVDFAGWSMPLQYTSIVAEHHATRTAAGLFDVSHMGRIRLAGPQAESLLDHLVTRRIATLAPGQIRYALVTNEAGGILDDVLVYHLQDRRGGRPYYQLVVNANNRQKIVGWIDAHRPANADVEIVDQTLDTAMIAVQGPRAMEILRRLGVTDPAGFDPAGLKYYTGADIELAHAPAIVSRTGYTGEDGCELIVPAAAALDVWQGLLEAGESTGAVAAGLGCRDTLRLEAAMPLYGHELSEQINPFQAGLGFAVDLEDRSFPGRDALVKLRGDKNQPRRVGWELAGRRAAREGYAVLAGGERVGHVTSGTFSPTLDRPIAMGYCRPEWAEAATEVSIDIRGRGERARVVKLPFYRRRSQEIFHAENRSGPA
jgi:aminomethyltransferase